MAQLVSLPPPLILSPPHHQLSATRRKLLTHTSLMSLRQPPTLTRHHDLSISTQRKLTLLTRSSVKSNGRFSCLFGGNSKQERARKAIDSALGGKQEEFQKWDKEIKKREEAALGGNSGGGGWFGWGRWFGGSGDEHFWFEAQQATLTVLAILAVYLVVAKGDVILAVVLNPLLVVLRAPRTALTGLIAKISNMVHGISQGKVGTVTQGEVITRVSAKDRVLGKWGSA